MLSVKLHLAGGDVIALNMTLSQKNRISRTMNQNQLPTTPFTTQVNGLDIEIPWRSIAYLSSGPQVQLAQMQQEAAD
ncbi:DUF2442 domain-containing protein [Deinococcus deserti]|uniref:Uncharacterized protein n=1 Tax=Deinococcus deserti (strain DSM 17065 / CIP 109153 / LMG 22923 / VCD115) TaxID=546414 RepID=X5H5N7_DEIDV|nr:hypothetical protein Deide_11206 [Deinococcus deserti VCD115]